MARKAVKEPSDPLVVLCQYGNCKHLSVVGTPRGERCAKHHARDLDKAYEKAVERLLGKPLFETLPKKPGQNLLEDYP